MKMKKSFAPDYRMFFYTICTLFIGFITFSAYKEGDKEFIILGTILLLAFVSGIVIFPKCYVADEKGISIYYLPFVKEYFEWSDIKRIKFTSGVGSSRSIILDWAWRVYKITPVRKRKTGLFNNAEISRNFFTKRMIKKYWDGSIEDNSFAWLKKHFSKNKSEDIKYDLSEVKQQETQSRDRVKQISSQYESKALLFGKTIDASCTYMTDEGDSGNRPKENYSYVAEIFVEKENDEEHSFYKEVELLFVSFGKKKIKITVNKNAEKEIETFINDAIEEKTTVE